MAPGRENAGTNRDNPQVVGNGDFWRRWMYRLGFRHSVFADEDAGIAPATGGVGSTYFLAADGTWAVPAGSGGINELTGDVTAGPGSGAQAATIADSAVTLAKIADASANSVLLGAGDSGSGSAYTQITLGTGLTMTGTELSASSSGGLPPNDDYGDVTVTDDGATWTIDPQAVTLAKIANASNSKRLLGSSETGGGSSYSELEWDSSIAISGSTISVPGVAANAAAIAANAVDIAANAAGIVLNKGYIDDNADAIAAHMPRVLDTEFGAPVRSISSTSYTDIYSYTIPANTLGAVRLSLRGDLLQDDSAQNLKMGVMLGGVTIWGNQASGNLSQSSTRRTWRLDIELCSTGTGTQHMSFGWDLGFLQTSGSGIGRYYQTEDDGLGSAQSSSDETTPLTVAVRFAWNTSATAADVRLFSAVLEQLSA